MPFNGTTGWCSVDQTVNYWINSNNCIQVDTINLPDIDPNDGCNVEKIRYTLASFSVSVWDTSASTIRLASE